MLAACVTNPIDVIKIRLQIQGELSTEKRHGLSSIYGSSKHYRGMFHGCYTILREEGLRGLYKGLTASLLREGTYSTLRMGLYDVLKDVMHAEDPRTTPLWKKIVAGATAGALGSGIANPTDLVKVRMQAQGTGTAGHHYRNMWQAFAQIYRAEGVRGLYKGVGPTTQRATLLTASQLASYDHIKHSLLALQWLHFHEGIVTHFTASMLAGFIAAVVTSPVDVIKTRIMNQRGHQLYTSTLDCALKTLRTEGPLGLYKGFVPNWLRIGPHTVVTFIVFEQLRRLAGIRPV